MKKSRIVPQMVPELAVRDPAALLQFYVDVLGWTLVHERPEDGFAYLPPEGMDLMLDSVDLGRNFDQSIGVSDQPLGRGLNLEMTLAAIGPVLAGLPRAEWPLVVQPEDMRYRCGALHIGQRQLVVADPDGCLLRFCERSGDHAQADGASNAV